MNRDDIIRIAQEAGIEFDPRWGTCLTGNVQIARFYELATKPLQEEINRLRFCIPEGDAAAAMEYLAHCVEKAVAEEREACAKVCEKLPEMFKIAADEFGYQAEIPTAENYAAAIRTRDDT